ncbi:MAG: hypothetical protein ACRBCT_10230 [Alphaproteobacteria bacterium]
MFYSWSGAGRSYPKPGAPGIAMVTANTRDRDYPLDYGMSSRITVGGAQNRADFSNYHAGIESEAIKAYKQNFQS